MASVLPLFIDMPQDWAGARQINPMIWLIVGLGIGGVIFRPLGIREVYPAILAAAALVLFRLLPLRAAWAGLAQGANVYLFLGGMMVLAELARGQGLFGWLAARTARLAHGSAARLFALVYLLGIPVTVFLSNDATAVVMSPAVAAVARAVQASDPLPFMLICAFIANAASFVLPISNPANLVIYGSHMPKLAHWLAIYAAASFLSILATFLLLRFTERRALQQKIMAEIEMPVLSAGGRYSGFGILATGIALLAASYYGLDLGLPTALAGGATMLLVCLLAKTPPWPILREVSWSTLLLVAGLFVMIQALDHAGAVAAVAGLLQQAAHASQAGIWAASFAVTAASNLMNNLPAGLLAAHALQAAHAGRRMTAGVLVGVDLGPNLSVTGSLATILWLQALRREGMEIGAWQFLKKGMVIMPPALILALLGLMI